jgi:hypothetical protein
VYRSLKNNAHLINIRCLEGKSLVLRETKREFGEQDSILFIKIIKTIQFSLNQPLQLELINRIAQYYAEKNQA